MLNWFEIGFFVVFLKVVQPASKYSNEEAHIVTYVTADFAFLVAELTN